MRKNTKFSRFFNSLKFRLILMVIFLAFVPGMVIRIGVIRLYEARAISIRESELSGQTNILTNQIAKSEYMTTNGGIDNSMIQAQIDMLTTIYDGRVLIVDRALRVYKDTYNFDDRKTILSEEVILTFQGNAITKYDSENHYVEMTQPIIDPNDDTGEVKGVMLVSVSTDNIELNKSYLQQIAIVLQLVSGFIVMFFGILLVIRYMKPFEAVSTEIETMQESIGEHSLQVNDYTEIAKISENINSMMGRVKVMNDSRQEFVSNVSHELKTPLTSMKVLADSINSMPDAPLELYQEFMGDITNEVERETKIINDLLSLVKMDKSAADLNIESVNINDLLEQILKRLQPIGDKQKVELVMESFRPVTAEIDEVKMTLAFTNLIENAIKYNRTEGDGWVHVTLNADHQFFYLKVEDNGIGIPEEALEHIYERFYRVDKSHSREIGGTGLGLAITRSCILMHRGAIKVYSAVGEGTTFDVRIPLNYITQG